MATTVSEPTTGSPPATECGQVRGVSNVRFGTGLEVIDRPRSAWMMSWPATIYCRWQLSSMRTLASAAASRRATSQPTT